MADIERIVPPVPTLPTPVGGNVGSNRRHAPQREPAQPRSTPEGNPEPSLPRNPESDHIDEYV